MWKGIYTNGQSDAAAAACRQIGVFPTSTGSTSSTVTVLRNRWRATRQPSIRNLVLLHWLAAPGAGLLNNPSFRVINAAVSGSGVAAPFTGISMTAQRDDPAGPLIYLYPGGHRRTSSRPSLASTTCTSGGALAAATHYANMVALLNTTTTGYLQRGFKVVVVTPTAYGGDAAGMTD